MSDDKQNSSDDLKRKILASMNTSTFTGEATQRWITAMKDEAFDAVEEEVLPAADSARLTHSMAAVIDRLFDNFKRYSFEYNRTQEDREYEINCERPASMRTSAEYMDMGKPIKFCLGHLASRHWAMIIQGEENRIFAYITPVEHLVGFKPSPPDFPAHVEMRLIKDLANKASRDMVWAINGQMLSQDSLPVLARRLFTQLVKVCKDEATYVEPFSLSPQEEKMALAQAASVPVDRSYEHEDAMLLGQTKKRTNLAERTFHVAAEQVEQLTAALASGTYPQGEGEPVDDRPPYNAMAAPSPLPPSIPASSNYPQIAAAIANGEPKALTSANPATPDTAPSFPRTQTPEEQAETFPKLPASDLSPIMAPNRTFVADSANRNDDEAIAAIIFQAPPGEQQAPPPPAPVLEEPEPLPELPEPEPQSAAHVPEVERLPEPEPAPIEDPPVQAAMQEVVELASQVEPEPPQPDPLPVPQPAPPPQAAPPPPAQAALPPPAQAAPPPPVQAAPAPPPPVASPWIGPNGEPARIPTPSQISIELPQQAKMEQNEAQNNGHAGLEKQSAEAKANIAQSLKGLFDTVDGAISGLTAIGMTAMHEDDLNTVSAVMKQTKSLKGFRDSVVALSKDWQQASE